MKTEFDVVLGIDMETDIGSFTSNYEGVIHGTPRLLEIMRRQNVRATYFWTGHAAENNLQSVIAVRDAGHETGCHGLVHETLGDPIFPLPNNWPIFPFEVEGRIKEATRIVKKISGVKPVSFRCPRLWGSTKVVNVLEKLGYKSDATLPLYFYRNLYSPYHPSSESWTEKGDLKLIEIPNFCDLSMTSSDPYNRDRDQWPLFRTEGAAALMKKIDSFTSYVSERGVRPVLAFYFHPWEFHRMPQGTIDYGEASVTPLPFITKNCGDVACREFEIMLKELKKRKASFKTAEEIADEWK
ncbi:MAG: polysaccharide deacetylase family protein [Lentisphaerae bacterium]|nr:polysaccharide deacetylase family protein [Lentisphaerota bacterium]